MRGYRLMTLVAIVAMGVTVLSCNDDMENIDPMIEVVATDPGTGDASDGPSTDKPGE